MPPNQYIMASDNSPLLLPLLREHPELARQQDEHGYSLIHAAASYNHLDLLRTLVREFHVPVDIRDEDQETALFVVETVEAARCLVEELGLDASIRGDLGLTAAEKLAGEEDFPLVAEYLASLAPGHASGAHSANGVNGVNGVSEQSGLSVDELPPAPEGISVRLGAMTQADGGGEDDHGEADPEFVRRIQELAGRTDFNTEEGQAALRELVEDAIANENLATEDRQVRPRQG